jgi:hypothetical protein
MRQVGHVALMGRRRMHIGFWWNSQKERFTRGWEDNIATCRRVSVMKITGSDDCIY